MNKEAVNVVQDDEIDLIDLWRALWAYKYVFVGSVAVCALAAVYLALTATEVFKAETTVNEVEDSGDNLAGSLASQFGGIASLAGIKLGGGGSLREAQAILQSRRLAEEFIKRHDLIPVLLQSADSQATLWKAVEQFRGGVLKIRRDELSGLTTLSVLWKDPQTAARWANEYVALANEILRSRAIEESARNIAYLNSQVAKTTVVEVQKVMYNLVEAETKKQMLASGKEEYAFTVVDPAVAPEIRTSPKRTLIVLFGIVIGMFIGAVVAFVHGAVVRQQLSKLPAG